MYSYSRNSFCAEKIRIRIALESHRELLLSWKSKISRVHRLVFLIKAKYSSRSCVLPLIFYTKRHPKQCVNLRTYKHSEQIFVCSKQYPHHIVEFIQIGLSYTHTQAHMYIVEKQLRVVHMKMFLTSACLYCRTRNF